MRLCFGTFASILCLGAATEVTNKQLVGTMTRTVDPNCGYIYNDTQVSRLLSCENNFSNGRKKRGGIPVSNVIKEARNSNREVVGDKFKNAIVPLLDNNKTSHIVLALRELVQADATIDGDNKDKFKNYTSFTKDEFIKICEFEAGGIESVISMLPNILAGLFLYTVLAVENKEGSKEYVENAKKYFRKYSQNVNELNGDLVSKSFRQIDTLPFIRNEYFIGRTAYLEQIRNKFSAGGALTIQAIYGLDGMGKTQLALEYAHDALLNNKYDFICWIDCSNEETIKESCCYFLAKIGETEPLDAISRLNLWLQSNSNWLMVLDDFKKDKLIERLMPKRGKGNIFITTRQNIDIFSSEPTIELVCMDKDEAVEYLIKRTNIDGRANAELIAKRLEFFHWHWNKPLRIFIIQI